MAWTLTLPTETGFYWFRKYEQDVASVVQVELYAPSGVVVLSPGLVCRSIGNLAGTELWNGPIQPPD